MNKKDKRSAEGYRENWFAHNDPDGIFGRYRCRRCGRSFRKKDIEIDHMIPVRMGGTDDLWNLQPLCRRCNRLKSANASRREIQRAKRGAFWHGDSGKLERSMRAQERRDWIGLPYMRDGRLAMRHKGIWILGMTAEVLLFCVFAAKAGIPAGAGAVLAFELIRRMMRKKRKYK